MSRISLITAFLVSLLAVVGLAVAPAAAGTYAIDDNHDLGADASITQFQDDGYVATNVEPLDLKITIAADEDDVGINTARADFETTYLCLDYGETIPRTIRVHVESDYWYPYPVEDEASVTDDETTMDMRPTEDKQYSSIQVEFDGATRACWEIKKQASIYFSAKGWSSDKIENQTGFRPPSIAGSADDWNYIPPESFDAHDGTVGLNDTNGTLTLQYDQNEDPHEEHWVSVPDCGSLIDRDPGVCKHDDGSGEILLLSKSSNETNVRFKHERDYRSLGVSGLKDLHATIERTLANVKSGLGRVFD